MSEPAQRRGGALDVVVAVVLVLAGALAAFVCGVMWLADFDDSDATTGPAGLSALLLVLGIVVGAALAVTRRSWRMLSIAVLVVAVLAALPWLSLL